MAGFRELRHANEVASSATSGRIGLWDAEGFTIFHLPSSSILLPFTFFLYAPRMFSFSRRLLPVLQLTRMALVFTAIADSNTGLLIGASSHAAANGGDIADYLDPGRIVALFLLSTGMYGFGMSLNDIIDRRRDSLMAA